MTVSADAFAPSVECRFEASTYLEHYSLTNRHLWIRPVDVAFDREILHRWMNLSHVSQFWNMAWPLEKIEDYLRKAEARSGFDAFIAYMDEEPFAYFEVYDPARDRMKDYYDVQAGDIGLHILIGEEKYLKRYTLRLSVSLMRFVFQAWPETRRIIGEPDERNKQVLGLMRFLGFRFIQKLPLPEKTAEFMILDQHDFKRAHGRER